MIVYFPGPYTFKDHLLYNLITLDYIGKKSGFFVHKWRSDTSQQRKSKEFFILICLVLGKWCGFFVHKWRSLNSQKKFLWIFCPQMTLTQIPICGFFVHNFQIGVKTGPGQANEQIKSHTDSYNSGILVALNRDFNVFLRRLSFSKARVSKTVSPEILW